VSTIVRNKLIVTALPPMMASSVAPQPVDDGEIERFHRLRERATGRVRDREAYRIHTALAKLGMELARFGANTGSRPQAMSATGPGSLLHEAVMRNSTLNFALAQAVVTALALLATPWAQALSLGEAVPQSSLGQPLRVAVPVSAVSDQALSAACVHVVADGAAGSGQPRLFLQWQRYEDRC